MLELIPYKRHIANSESSVIYPAPIPAHGPPPGIFMHSSIFSSEIIMLLNSLKEPHESPMKAPSMHPNARSSKLFFNYSAGMFYFSISILGSIKLKMIFNLFYKIIIIFILKGFWGFGARINTDISFSRARG